MDSSVSLIAAFAAGFLSFVSPCVLPLIPGYISFVSGVSVEEMRGDSPPATSRLQIGVLILTGQLTLIVRFLEPYLPVF